MVLLTYKDERKLIEPRVKLLMLVFLSVAHTLASSRLVFPLALFTLIICALHPSSFLRGAKIIVVTAVALGMFALVVRLTGYSIPLGDLGIDYLRLFSLSTVSVVLFLSMNSLEVITSLSYFRLPIGIALAIGIGLRFLPVFVEEAKRIRVMQSHRRDLVLVRREKSFALMVRLDKTVSPFIVSVLRRVDLLLISIAVQQLQDRVRAYRVTGLRARDWVALAATGGVLVASFLV